MRLPNVQEIHRMFTGRVQSGWSFEGVRSTNNLTHGYHRYPAKFLPELVKKLIEDYTHKNDRIADVFAGCGTTLVEGKAHGRRTIGVDINPVAQLITKAKINPVKPQIIKNTNVLIDNAIMIFSENENYYNNTHPRIDYWFEEKQKNQIAFLYNVILDIENEKIRDFYLCALSHILKNCSKWLQDGTKPQIDPSKKPADVFSSFRLHVKKMMKKNEEFYVKLKNENFLATPCDIKLADARRTRIHSGSVNAIITSPPYVTSYEYADIHQLTGYWYEYITDLTEFRRQFIGTFYSLNKVLEVSEYIPTGVKIVNQLKEVDAKCAREVANYFNDMLSVAKEMYRILDVDGVACLVIGNTELKQVKIKSAEVFAEMLYAVGFEIEDVIKRNISHKLIPTVRDVTTGKFTTLDSKTSKQIYPNEYIIIAKKR